MDQFVRYDTSEEKVIVNDTVINSSPEYDDFSIRQSNVNILHQMDFSSMSPALINRRNNSGSLDNIMNEVFKTVLSRIDNLEAEKERLILEISNFKKEIKDLKKNTSNYQVNTNHILNDLDIRLVRNEQYVNRESIILSGIPSNVTQENLEETVLHVLHTIGLKKVSSYDIAACHRLAKRKNDPYPARTIIRFTNRKIVQFCLRNRNLLKFNKDSLKMNLRFFECLCSSNERILKECSEVKHYGIINKFFISNGFMKVITNEHDNPIKMKNSNMLHELFKDFYRYELSQ